MSSPRGTLVRIRNADQIQMVTPARHTAIEGTCKSAGGPPTSNMDGTAACRTAPITRNGNTINAIWSPLPTSSLRPAVFLGVRVRSWSSGGLLSVGGTVAHLIAIDPHLQG